MRGSDADARGGDAMTGPSSRQNDGGYLTWYDEAGNAVDCTGWREARDHLTAHLMGDTANPGWAAARAEGLLNAIFPGRTGV